MTWSMLALAGGQGTPLIPSFAQASASKTYAHQPADRALVSITVKDSTILFIVNDILRQARLQAVYNTTAPAFSKRTTVRIVNAPVMDALTTVLQGTGLAAKLAPDAETVVIRAKSIVAPVAGGTVTGRVTDSASGAGLSGAQVKVAGTKVSTVTSDSGNFTLRDVPAGEQVLSIRLFGYKPVDRTITVVDSQRTSVHITMIPVPTVLSGVVTTATGQQQRYQVGNDITVLHADSIQQIAPVSNITQMLETRVPGLIVEHSSGIPGAPSRLRIRGVGSINSSSDPILIVDGIRVNAQQSGTTKPTSYSTNGLSSGTQGSGGSTIGNGSQIGNFSGPSALDQIDPNDIETIEVLKGPSATSIYGSDAANGVIIITTKHGQVGPTRWDATLNSGLTTLPGSWPTNYYRFGHEGIAPEQLCSAYDVAFDACTQDSIVAFQALNDSRYSPLTGQAGRNNTASLTVSGGSGALTYSVTGTASSQSGYLHLPDIELQRFQTFHGFAAPSWMRTPDQYSTYGASSQLTIQLGKTGATLALSGQLFNSAQQQSSLQSDLQSLEYSYVDTSQLASQPLFSNYYQRAQLKTTTFTNSVALNNLAPWHWLPMNATAGLSVQSLNNNTLLPRDYITCLGNTYDQSCGTDSLGSYALSQGTNTTGSLTVGTNLAQRYVNTAVGLNVYTVSGSSYGASTVGLPIGVSIPSSFVYKNGTGPSYSTASTATYGWYVQPTLNLNSHLFVSPGFRLDGGSASGSNNGGSGTLSLFPKIDVSWIALTRPPSDPLFGALTLLRPRIAFGIAGVQPAPAEQLRLLQPAQVIPLTPNGPGAPVDILQFQTLGNTQLHPERDRELEGGVDAEFWNQRLSLTLTGYHKMAYDAILAIPVAPSVNAPGGALGGQGSYTVDKNIGTIRNTGVEATAFARILDNRSVEWSVNANVSQNRNLLVSLVKGQPPIEVGNSGYDTRLTPGYPVFSVWAPPILSYADVNHDGLIEPNEVRTGDSSVYLGAQQPNYELSLSTTLALFNDRLSINTGIDYQNGLTQINQAAGLNQELALNNPVLTLGEQAAIAAGGGFGYSPMSDIGAIQTVNFLRWNTFSATYNFSPQTAHRFRVHALSVTVQGANLALHTNYRGKDPAVSALSVGNQTVDTGNELPQPRVWQLRLNLGN